VLTRAVAKHGKKRIFNIWCCRLQQNVHVSVVHV